MTLSPFAERIKVASSGIREVLLKDSVLVGGIYTMGYQRALVLTNDFWKNRVGGIPQNCFLLATTLRPDTSSTDPDEEEILLLRAEKTAQLPRESELLEVREEAMRTLLEEEGLEAAARDEGIVDVLTRNEIQFSAFDCKVLGTFYDDVVSGRKVVQFGADVDTVYAASRYFVYKPVGDTLSFIASYTMVKPEELEQNIEPEYINIGTVRYSSTRRRSSAHKTEDVPVDIRIDDFVSMKTAVFGMTRFGKSNTMKIIATGTFAHSRKTNVPIGQLLFDPAGEYATTNVQDMTALANIGPEWVTIYRFGVSTVDAGVKPLQINFFARDQLTAAREIVQMHLQDANAVYIDRMLAAELDDPEDATDFSGKSHASRGRFAFYAALAKADFKPPKNWTVRVSMKKALADAVLNAHPGCLKVGENANKGHVFIDGDHLQTVMDWLVANQANNDVSEFGSGESYNAMRAFYEDSTSRAGTTRLAKVRAYHNPLAAKHFAEAIYEDLVAGKIVIVDLSRGNEQILQVLSEHVINAILKNAAERFTTGKAMHRIQLFIEEAHRLFDREKFLKSSNDPYVRLAKEAAKYKIGLVYATQEVSSVEPRVLSNTSNWVVAHLNNSYEIGQLCRYYDFDAYQEQILRAEERGFVRLKTLSGRYIVPVQVARFDHEMVNQARGAAGLPPIDVPAASS